jgi:5S rRNA maturation endonuclease (ribonuclease M5)
MNPSAPDPFIGREHEIDIYEQWLTDPNAPRILYFYDAAPEPDKKGGVGKTRLLQECMNITKEEHKKEVIIVIIDFFRITDRNGRIIAERIYNQIKEAYPNWSGNSFDRALREEIHREHQQATKKDGKNNVNPSESRNKLSKALLSDLCNLDTYLQDIEQEEQFSLLVVLDTFEVIQSNPSVAVLSPYNPFPMITTLTVSVF